jgi:hypothetical protein
MRRSFATSAGTRCSHGVSSISVQTPLQPTPARLHERAGNRLLVTVTAA